MPSAGQPVERGLAEFNRLSQPPSDAAPSARAREMQGLYTVADAQSQVGSDTPEIKRRRAAVSVSAVHT